MDKSIRPSDPLLLASRTRLPTLMLARAVLASLAVAPTASSPASGPRAALASPDPRRVPGSTPRLGARLGTVVRAIDRVSTLRVRRAASGAARRGASAMSAAAKAASAPEGPLFLGLDFGTSGARCVAVDARGDAVAETSAKYPPIVDGGKGGDGIPRGGWAEAWRGALWSLLDDLPVEVRERVVSVAVDGTSGTALVVNGDDGSVVYPPMLYNEKRDDAVDAVAAVAPEGHTTRSASSALCKLHSWWFETEGGKKASAKRSVPHGESVPVANPKLLHHADWVAYLLHGVVGVTDHNNALKLGFDPGLGNGENGTGAYPDWILRQPYAAMLPMTCLAPGTVAGACVTTEAKKRFPNAERVRVVAGTTDSVAAFAAARCSDCGDCVTSLGSSLALKLVSETRVDDAAAGVYSHRLCGKWLVGGASNLGGWLLRSHFDDDELVKFTAELRDEPTGVGDDAVKNTILSELDYFPGVLMGFGLSVEEATKRLSSDRPESDAEFLRAILSSVARVEARSYDTLVSMGASHAPKRVFTAGGGARNDFWSSLRSEAMGGVFVAKSPFTEAAYGTALLARMGHYGYDTYVPSPEEEDA
jgi:sugar (pentulose or hexulose) kinase